MSADKLKFDAGNASIADLIELAKEIRAEFRKINSTLEMIVEEARLPAAA